MAALGNIGASAGFPSLFAGYGAFTRVKQPVSVDATGTGTPNAMVNLSHENGARVDTMRSDSSGDWHFYDLDDGTYYASEVGSANAWEIEVSGSSATVTALSGGGGGGGGSTGHFSFG